MSRAKINWERKWYPLTIAQTAKCYARFVYCCFYVATVFLNGFCVCLFFCLVNVVSEMSSFSVGFFFKICVIFLYLAPPGHHTMMFFRNI